MIDVDSKEYKNSVKHNLLQNGKFDLYKNIQYAEYSKYLAEGYGTEINSKYSMYLGVDDSLSAFEKKCCKQLFDSRRQRIRRLKAKLLYRIENFTCLFLTLTFTDDVLNNTNEITRRKYIQRFLKSLNFPFYVANIDYGDKEKNPDSKEREHYHAIVQSDFLDMSLYKYGFIYVEKIKNDTNSITKISKYINKLSAHAFKDSTKGQSRLIYSREKVEYKESKPLYLKYLVEDDSFMPF